MKKVSRQTIILMMALVVSSCGSKGKKNEAPAPTTENKQQIQPQETKNPSTNFKLELDDFKGIPAEVSGCSCYFSENAEKFEKEKYLFAAGLGGPGFISVNNKLVKLNLISSEQNPTNSGEYDRIDIYDSERYKVTVDINFKNTNGYETW